MMTRRLAPLLLIACLLVQTGAAKSASPNSPKSLHFLSPTSIDPIALLPEPSPKDSPEQAIEIDTVLTVQKSRTQSEVARANSEAKFTVFAFADVLGPSFNADKCPKTAELFGDAESDAKYFAKLAKGHFDRQRPGVVDDRVKPSIPGETDASYPSGHATRGMLFAELLAEIFPDQRAALLARGRQIGWDRVIAGVHYPTDIFAGRTLGQALAHALLANDQFKQKLHAVADELHQAHVDATAAAK